MQLLIRRADAADAEVLADYNCRLAHETEDRTLDKTTVLNGVRRGLGAGEEVQYLVAEVDNQVVGQLMLTREWSDWRDGWMYWVQSVYVHKPFRGQGVFRQLLHKTQEQLAQQGDVVCLRLYVEDENQSAQETYRRLGFSSPGYRVMERPLQGIPHRH